MTATRLKPNVVIGLVIVLLVFLSFNQDVETQATIGVGTVNDFLINPLSIPSNAEEGSRVEMSINVKNIESNFGSMQVQCSILDPQEHVWLQSIRSPVTIDNCVAKEPFTQTKIVELDAGQDTNVDFRVTAPSAGTYTVYCAAYEFCYSPDRESLVSDEYKKDITITKKSTTTTDTTETTTEEDDEEEEDETVEEDECKVKSLIMLFKGQDCVDGKIVDKEKEVEEPTETIDIKESIQENPGITFTIGIIVFIIVTLIVFQDKKKKEVPLF